jgi:hypothetical protein
MKMGVRENEPKDVRPHNGRHRASDPAIDLNDSTDQAVVCRRIELDRRVSVLGPV